MQSSVSSKTLRKHRTGWGLRAVPVDGALRSTRSHSTDARRYKVARSKGLEARRCSKNSSRVKPNAAIDDIAWDKSGRNG